MTGQSTRFNLFAGLEGEAKQQAGSPPIDPTPALPPQPLLRPLPSCSDTPIVRAATRLLNLVARLRTMSAMPNLAALRQSLIAEVRFFEDQALAANVSRDEIIAARYCLCTALDEAAGQTPWGGNGAWASHSLLVSFHNETWGGEKYYQLLTRLAQHPERHRALIELLYYCNMLGFEGKFRIADNGHAQLEILKRRIATLLKSGEHDSRLSSHWQGEQTQREAWRMIPPWVVAAVCGLLAFALYVVLSWSLAHQSDDVFRRLAALEPPGLFVPEPPRPPPPRLRRFLEPEILAGLLDVDDRSDRSIVTLKGDGLFASGSVDISAGYLDVLTRIAQALDEVEGNVVVTGYTDSVPIRSVRFPSNWHLSEARARAVAAWLAQRMAQHDRVRAEGGGEAKPVAENTTAEGRALNRRVEITLMLSAEAILRQLNPEGQTTRGALR